MLEDERRECRGLAGRVGAPAGDERERSFAAPSHADDALQNVLVIRPKESRALRLAKDIEADEQEYVQLRQEKAAL